MITNPKTMLLNEKFKDLSNKTVNLVIRLEMLNRILDYQQIKLQSWVVKLINTKLN